MDRKAAKTIIQKKNEPIVLISRLTLSKTVSGDAGSTKDVRYQANQEKNDEDEKANSGDLSGSKSYSSKTEKTGDHGDYKEDQRIVKHGDT
jgi:hypothetical protein